MSGPACSVSGPDCLCRQVALPSASLAPEDAACTEQGRQQLASDTGSFGCSCSCSISFMLQCTSRSVHLLAGHMKHRQRSCWRQCRHWHAMCTSWMTPATSAPPGSLPWMGASSGCQTPLCALLLYQCADMAMPLEHRGLKAILKHESDRGQWGRSTSRAPCRCSAETWNSTSRAAVVDQLPCARLLNLLVRVQVQPGEQVVTVSRLGIAGSAPAQVAALCMPSCPQTCSCSSSVSCSMHT